MSEVNFQRDYKKLMIDLTRLVNSLNEREVSLRLGRRCREIIYRRVKSGYGVDSDADAVDIVNRKQLKPLAKSYIDYRKGLVIFRTGKGGRVYSITNKDFAASVLGGKTVRGSKRLGTASHTKVSFKKTAFHHLQNITPPKLGEFGRPTKSNLTLTGQMLNALAIVTSSTGFKLYIADTARTTPDGKADKITNKKVAEYVSINGRPFMALTEGEVRILAQELELIVTEKLQKLASR